MQPQTPAAIPPVPAKPVMDVTPPPSQQIAVRQAPAEENDEVTAAQTAPPSPAPAKPVQKQAEPSAKLPKQLAAQQLPTGLIVATVGAMVVLSILAVVIYVTSQN